MRQVMHKTRWVMLQGFFLVVVTIVSFVAGGSFCNLLNPCAI
jgi:hypothetical protein